MERSSLTSPRRIPTQQRSRVTVDAIVQAAARLLVSRGWRASTTNHIAHRAGVGVGSLYKYFPNKASILAEVARRRISSEVAAIEASLAAHAHEPRLALETMLAAMLERYAENAELDTQLLEQLGPLEVGRFLRSAEAQVVQATEAFLAQNGRTSPAATAFIVVHAVRGTLIAAAAQDPALLRAEGFRRELWRLVDGFLRP